MATKNAELKVGLPQYPEAIKETLQLNRYSYSTGFKLIEKINATAPQPQRNALKYFAIFKNFAHSFETGKTPSYSVSHQAPNYVCLFVCARV